MNSGGSIVHAFPTSIAYKSVSSSSMGGRMSLPVSRSNYLYAHFKHVSGVPAPEGGQGVTISKLKILDVLIEHLSQLRRRRDVSPGEAPHSEERLDALIAQYETQIRQTKAVGAAIPYAGSPVRAGALFSMVA